MRRITLLGTGFIGNFYTTTLLGMRSRDEIRMVCGATMEGAKEFAQRHSIPRWTDSIEEAVNEPETDLIVSRPVYTTLRRDLQHLERWGYQKDYDRVAKTYALARAGIERQPVGHSRGGADEMGGGTGYPHRRGAS